MADKTINLLVHILGLLTWVIGPLIVLLAIKDTTAQQHAKTALNWQISATIYYGVAFLLMFLIIGFALLPLIGILNLIFCIVAAVKAANGELWKYPLSIPFLRV